MASLVNFGNIYIPRATGTESRRGSAKIIAEVNLVNLIREVTYAYVQRDSSCVVKLWQLA